MRIMRILQLLTLLFLLSGTTGFAQVPFRYLADKRDLATLSNRVDGITNRIIDWIDILTAELLQLTILL